MSTVMWKQYWENNEAYILNKSIKLGDVKRIQTLLESGVDPDVSVDSDDDFPIHEATFIENIEIVRLLLDYGANIDCKDSYGDTVLTCACEGNNIEIVTLLLDYGVNIHGKSNRLAIHNASRHGHLKIVRLLLDYEADPNAKNNNGETPLHQACDWDNDEVIKLLLEHGADPMIKNNDDFCPDLPSDNPYKRMFQLKEWRPWNHSEYPLEYRQSTTTLVLLAKTIKP